MIDYRTGDTRQLVATLDDQTVDLIATSPPFLALRSYLPDDHDHKDAEIGAEPDPATYLDTLLGLTAEWGRTLTPYGSIAVELGDTYSGSGGAGGDYGAGGKRDGQQKFKGPANQGGGAWPRAKSLALIPQLYACSLAYGRNLLTGEPSPAGQWLVRNVVVWHRPNPAVGALADKYRPSTSYITVATRNPKRWFDLTAVRTRPTQDPGTYTGNGYTKGNPAGNGKATAMPGNPAGAPPLDCWFDDDFHDTWTVTTQPSQLAHYAMWPPKLAERLILSMCPEQVCLECGEPRRRIEQADPVGRTANAANCGHDTWRTGVVLDPFAGTGTTLCVADLHGRTGIGFDLDPRNRGLLDARKTEVHRALTGATPQLPGQLGLAL